MRTIFFMVSMLGAVLALVRPVAATPAAAAPARFGMPDQKAARTTAERVYSTWRIGMTRGDETAWKSVTTRSRQMKVRNLIVSQKGNFPQDFFRDQPEPPSLDNIPH